jgi:hypothetical protein
MIAVVQNGLKIEREISRLGHRSSTLPRRQIQAMIMIAVEAALFAVLALTALELLAVREFNGMGDAIVILDPRMLSRVRRG